MTDTRIKPEQAVHGATGGNMKRMAAAVLAAMMVFSLAACAGAEEETEVQEQTQTREQTQADRNRPDYIQWDPRCRPCSSGKESGSLTAK